MAQLTQYKMLKYGGSDFQSIDSHVHLVDIVIGAPERTVQTIEPALRRGAIRARTKIGTRKIIVTYVIMCNDVYERRRISTAVLRWAGNNAVTDDYSSDRTMQLMGDGTSTPGEAFELRDVWCTSMPDVSATEYWDVLTLQFTAMDPYCYALQSRTVTLAENARTNIAAYQQNSKWIYMLDWSITFAVSENKTDYEPSWQFVFRREGSSQYDHYLLSFSFPTLTKTSITLNGDKRTAVNSSGNSILPNMSLGSRFPPLDTARITGIITSGDAAGTFRYTGGWL